MEHIITFIEKTFSKKLSDYILKSNETVVTDSTATIKKYTDFLASLIYGVVEGYLEQEEIINLYESLKNLDLNDVLVKWETDTPYKQGKIVFYNDNLWESTIDDNYTIPGSDKWIPKINLDPSTIVDLSEYVKKTTTISVGSGLQGGGDLSENRTISLDFGALDSRYEAFVNPGTTFQYYRGDKTWQTLNTAVVPESGNLYFTEARVRQTPLTGFAVGSNVSINSSDSVLSAFGKIQGQFNALPSIYEPIILAGTTAQYWRGDKTWQTLNTSVVPEGSNQYWTLARFNTAFATKSTTDLVEGINLYYTQARFNSAFANKTTTDLLEGSNLYYTQARFDSAFAVKTTTNLAEGTNLYWTQARFDNAFNAKSTSNLAEGSNLYWTQNRFDLAFDIKTTDDLTEGLTNFYWTQTRFDTAFANKSTSFLQEGSNLYYTNARVDARINAQKGVAGGIAPLNSSVKIDEIYLPDSVLGQLEFQGVYNGATDTPALGASTSANKGWFYIVDVAGGGYSVGDWALSTGTEWKRINNSDAVTSVFGRLGNVVANAGDYTTALVTEASGYLYYTDARVQAFADTRYSLLGHTHTFASLTSKPTTLSGYGITDGVISSRTILATGNGLTGGGDLTANRTFALDFTYLDSHYALATNLTNYYTKVESDARFKAIGWFPTFAEILSKPNTIGGFGITDAYTKTEQDARYAYVNGVNAYGTWNIISNATLSADGMAFDFNHVTTNMDYMVVRDITTSKVTLASPATILSWLGSPSSGETLQSVINRNGDAYFSGTTRYGVQLIGQTVATNILLVGQSGYSNGFTIGYDGTKMNYNFLDGNVGIGTLSPSQALGYGLTINNSGGYSTLYLQNGGIDKGFFTATVTQVILGTLDSSLTLQFNTSGVARYTISNSGTHNFQNGEAYFGGIVYANSVGGNIRIKADGSGTLDGGVYATSDGNLYFRNWAGTRGLRIAPNGISEFIGGTVIVPGLISNSFISGQSVAINHATGLYRDLQWQTSGSLRWNLYAGPETETGSNAGSNLSLSRYADNGSYLGNIFTIVRADGAFNFATPVYSTQAISSTVGFYGNLTGIATKLHIPDYNNGNTYPLVYTDGGNNAYYASGIATINTATNTITSNISGNASTANNATNWGGYSNDYSGVETNPDFVMTLKSGVGKITYKSDFITWLGTSGLYQPLEDQRLRTTDSVRFNYLEVASSATPYIANFAHTGSDTGSYSVITVRGGMTSAVGYYGVGGSTTGNTWFRDAFVIGTQTNHILSFHQSDARRAYIDGTGDFYSLHSFRASENVTWGGNNSGNARALRIGWTGAQYGALGYGINFTNGTTETYAINDIVSKTTFYKGITVESALAGSIGTDITWTTVMQARTDAFTWMGYQVARGDGGTYSMNIIGSASKWNNVSADWAGYSTNISGLLTIRLDGISGLANASQIVGWLGTSGLYQPLENQRLSTIDNVVFAQINAQQGRFAGWYTSGSGDAVEIGFSGSLGNIISYNRTTTTYKELAINSSDLFLQTSTGGRTFIGGNVGLGDYVLSGGGNAKWMTVNGTTYSGGIIYSVNGTPKGYSYYDIASSALLLQGADGAHVGLSVAGVVKYLISASTGHHNFGGNAYFDSTVTAPYFSGNLDGGIWNLSSYMKFHWSDGGSEPTWLWGSNASGDAYVYSPSVLNTRSAGLLRAGSIYTALTTHLPTDFPLGMITSFVQGGDGWPSYGSLVTLRTYSSGGGSLQLYVPYSPTYGGGNLQVRFGNYEVDGGNSWTAFKTLMNQGDTAYDSTRWGGYANNYSTEGSNLTYLNGFDGTTTMRYYGVASVRTWLGLGTSAYLNADEAPIGSTVVKRNSLGYVFGTYFNASANKSSPTNSAPFTLIGHQAGADDYYYDYSASAVKLFLGLGSSAYLNAYVSVSGDTVVQRNSSGDIFGRYIESTYLNSSDDVSSTLGYIVGKNGSDNYHRSYTASTVGAFLQYRIYSRATYDANAVILSGTYGMSIHSLDNAGSNLPGGSYGNLLTFQNSDTSFQILGGYQADNMWFRGAYSSGTGFTAWRQVLHSGNYLSYTSGVYQPLEDQRLSTGNSVQFASAIINGKINLLSNGYLVSSSSYGFLVNRYGDEANVLRHDGSNFYVRGNIYVGGNGYSDGVQVVYNSGTWGISITGSSASVSGLTITNSSNPVHEDNTTQNQIGYRNGEILLSHSDGALYTSAYSSAWQHQIQGDFRTGQIIIRGKNSGTWQPWRTVLDSSNFNNYSPTLTGGGASGTWGINISGSASYWGGFTANFNATTASFDYVAVRTNGGGIMTLAGIADFRSWLGIPSGGDTLASVVARGSVSSGRIVINGGSGTSYSLAALEINGSSSAPVLGFHHSGVVASTISIETDGTIAIRDNPGTSYEKFKAFQYAINGNAQVIYESGGRLVIRANSTNNVAQFAEFGLYLPLTAGGTSFYSAGGINVGYGGVSPSSFNGSITQSNGTFFNSNGRIEVISNSVGSDPYGRISVTRGTAYDYSYFGMTRVGNIGWGIGIGTNNRIAFGTGSNDADNIFTSKYFEIDTDGTYTYGTARINGGAVMSSGWNRTIQLQASYPVLTFNTISNGNKWMGIGADNGLTFWVNSATSDVSGGGTVALQIVNTGNAQFYYHLSSNSFSSASYIQASTYIEAQGYVQGLRGIFGYDSGVAGSVNASQWFRSNGDTGWYSASYGGGIYMIDTTWVRVYNGKAFLVENTVQAPRFQATGANGFEATDYGIGLTGTYSAVRYQNVFSMGNSYKPSQDGTTLGSQYGISWTHPNVGTIDAGTGQSVAGLSHQMLIVESGSTMTAIGTGVWTRGRVTAGTGTDGGFENNAYNAGHNNIWRLRNAQEYGIGYYQGGTDYVGFHFGARATAIHKFYSTGEYRTTGEIHSGASIYASNILSATNAVYSGTNGFWSGSFRGMVGDYATNGTTDKIIWTIGTTWNDISTMYGIGYQYISKYVTSAHQIVFRVNGTVTSAINLETGSAYFDGYVNGLGGGGTSDMRWKILQDSDLDLTWLDKDRSISFKWDARGIDQKMHFGYSAQEINEWCSDLIFKENAEKWALNQVELLTLEVKRLKQRVHQLENQ